MDAAEFYGLLFTILSYKTSKNHIIHMIEEKYDYTMSNYVSQNFCIIIVERMTCISCHRNKLPKVLTYDSFILSLVETFFKGDLLFMIN